MMTMNYMDHAATTPVRGDVIEAMVEMMEDQFGNPSSLHRMGLKAERAMETARDRIAKFLTCRSEQIVFTSGGTEGNNLGMRGFLPMELPVGSNLCIGGVEHSSVLQVAKELERRGVECRLLPVDRHGRILMDEAVKRIDEKTILLSVQHVNNEVGGIQPIDSLGELIRKIAPKAHFHVDGVQAVGKIPVSLRSLDVDSYAFSGHKINATKGIGGLYLKDPKAIHPILWGSKQERGLRPGTENVPAIVGLGVAVAALQEEFDAHQASYIEKRITLIKAIEERMDRIIINTPLSLEEAAPHIVSVSFDGVKAEIVLHMLEMKGIYVSTGSACSSKARGNRILEQMGIAANWREGTLRISYSWDSSVEKINELMTALIEAVGEVRELTMR
jgi:cysteine desulfurase